MLTDGKMGELPEWYILLRAARLLGVPPWDLAERPIVWQEWALAAEGAEGAARADHERRTARRSKAKRK